MCWLSTSKAETSARASRPLSLTVSPKIAEKSDRAVAEMGSSADALALTTACKSFQWPPTLATMYSMSAASSQLALELRKATACCSRAKSTKRRRRRARKDGTSSSTASAVAVLATKTTFARRESVRKSAHRSSLRTSSLFSLILCISSMTRSGCVITSRPSTPSTRQIEARCSMQASTS
eukprot:910417-Prymnesium_polylepis.1